jgi:uncharacterized protein YbaA (DUF1428 family)
MAYVDGFILAVPREKLDAYTIWGDHVIPTSGAGEGR